MTTSGVVDTSGSNAGVRLPDSKAATPVSPSAIENVIFLLLELRAYLAPGIGDGAIQRQHRLDYAVRLKTAIEILEKLRRSAQS